MTEFRDDQLSCDDFLDGRLRIWQPLTGYRAATDPVFLAAAVGAVPGQSVLELGCGVGTALLCLAARIDNLDLSGVELQAEYAALANRNATQNDTKLTITHADISDMPLSVRDRIFDEVMTNPPFYAVDSASPPDDQGRDIARHERLDLREWIKICLRRTAPMGYFTIIHKAERLTDILSVLDGKAGDIRIKPLTARLGRDAGRVIVRARKGARGSLRLLPPLVIHMGENHMSDGDDNTPEARKFMRTPHAMVL